MKTIEERLAALEAVAPRCEAPGCDEFAKALCPEHDASWKKYVKEHPNEAHSPMGQHIRMYGLRLDWMESLKSETKP